MYKNIKPILPALFICVLFISCRPEQVEFIRIDNAVVIGAEGHFMVVEADAILFNPNKTNGRVKKVDIAVFFKQQEVAHINESATVKVGAGKEFSIPLRMRLDMNKIQDNWLNNLVAILRDKSVVLHFTGYIRIKILGVGYNVPVDYTEKIKL
ncbi:MAG: hypothetical protein IH947_05485 [Bacteroidetes bacterium]|nr:hypothetical protein [Bacteroidota bacterium]MCH8232230.1 hypothetical protein [Bacteroidota bacterium]